MVFNKGRILALLLVVVTFVGCGEDEEEAELKIEDLIIQLGDPDSYIALKASEKLIEVGEPAVPELVKVLSLPGVENRRELTLQTLQNIGDPAVKYLVPLLDDPSLRLEARDIIMGIGTTTALQILTKSLVAQLLSSYQYAFQGLVEIGKPAVPELIEVLSLSGVGDRAKTVAVIRVLRAIRTPEALKAVEAFEVSSAGRFGDGGFAAVTATVPATGGEIAANGTLIIFFYNGKNIFRGAVTVNGTLATLAGNQATWNAAGLTPGGSAALAIAWKNTDGTDGAASVILTVKAVDNTTPTVKGGTVKNGAKDVDPGPINEAGKLEVTFSEAVVKGEVSLGVDGGDALGTQAEWAGDKVTLSLNAGVALANETTYVITIKGVKDAAGNDMAETKITFTTK